MTNGTDKIFYIFSAPAQETSVSKYAGSNDINIFIITKKNVSRGKHRNCECHTKHAQTHAKNIGSLAIYTKCFVAHFLFASKRWLLPQQK